MVKTVSLAVLALVAALVVGFGQSLTTSTPKAQADTTGMAVVGCEFIVKYLPNACAPETITAADITTLATLIGNKDGKLVLSDFSSPEVQDAWDANQISTDCTMEPGSGRVNNDGPAGRPPYSTTVVSDYSLDIRQGFGCVLDVFVFVNSEGPVTFVPDSGLYFTPNDSVVRSCVGPLCPAPTDPPTLVPVTNNRWTCGTEAGAAPPPGTGFTGDNDCSSSPPNNGDGVVVAGLLVGTTNGLPSGPKAATAGDVRTITVTQGSVAQTAQINIVGPPNNVTLSLAETMIETNNSDANATACENNIPVSDAITPPTSTLAWAVVTDAGDRKLTRVPVTLSVQPPADDPTIADLGLGNPAEAITSTTTVTIDPVTAGAPLAFYQVVCGGRTTGKTKIQADINVISCAITGCSVLGSPDTSVLDLTVVGVPSAINVTAAASTIKCDGSQTSTVTAKVTDSAGNNVADGTPVNFSVVALGTANPINTVTKDGVATSTITPLSNSSAGVTVIVTADGPGSASTSISEVQTSVRVDCALPLATQPTNAPPPPPVAPTQIGVRGPDTGNGGYLGQSSSSSFPMWTLIALALGSMALVAGGVAARRAGK